MPSTFKNASLNPINTGIDAIYTVPSGTSAVAMSAICANLYAVTQCIDIGIAPAGGDTINWLAKNISVAPASSVNLLAGKVSLAAGDRFVANNTTAGISNWHGIANTSSFLPMGDPTVMLSNTDGSIIVATDGTSIRASLDGGKTSVPTTGGTPGNTGVVQGMYFAGEFWLYTSVTALRSTDGVTWTPFAAPTNGPDTEPQSTTNGGIILKGGAAFARRGTGQIVTSTDGVVWSLHGTTPPNTQPAWCWTGTHFIVGSTTASTLYRSTDGASWSAVTLSGTSSTTVNTRGLAAIGQYVVASWSNTELRSSSDHGATWTSNANGMPSGSTRPISVMGDKFVFSAAANRLATSTTGIPGSWSPADSYAGMIGEHFSRLDSWMVFTKAGNKWVNAYAASVDENLTRRGGATVTASVVEVS